MLCFAALHTLILCLVHDHQFACVNRNVKAILILHDDDIPVLNLLHETAPHGIEESHLIADFQHRHYELKLCYYRVF